MPRAAIPRAAVLFVLLAACGNHDPTKSHMVEGRYYVEPGAPDPLACASDADCMMGQVTDDTGRCIAERMPHPLSRAWYLWIRTLPGRHGTCPATISAPVPAECAAKARCAKGRCTGSC